MQRLGRHYLAIFNGRHGRTGTLREGRYKSCLVDSAGYVRCYRYIELNPLRARLIDDQGTYRWSSCEAEHSNAYRPLLDEIPSDELLANIRIRLQQQQALGHDAFRGVVEAKTLRFASVELPIGHQAHHEQPISQPTRYSDQRSNQRSRSVLGFFFLAALCGFAPAL